MSSWTNRGIPRKRDLTHIPDIYRPVIITRAENPHVVLSETFQAASPTAAPPSDLAFDRFLRSVDQPAQPSRGLPTPYKAPAPRAIELRRGEGSVVFVILRHLRTNKDNDLWISSYNAIRQYYTNPIVIIDDASTVNTINGKLVNTEVIYSEYSGAGEVLPYYYFWKNRWADHMIFLHDSMFLARPFRKDELGEENMRFLWHFTEPTERKLETYLTMLQGGAEAWEGLQTTGWRGCFGAAGVVSLEAVDRLEAAYEVWSRLVLAVRARVDRKMFERILGVLAGREGLTDGQGVFGDITKYPDAFESQAQTLAAAQRLAAGYDTAVWKVWKGR
jgi:hypothetical protein